MAEERDIKYVGKNFNDFRNQLTEFAKNYFPDTYNDFSPTSPGMMFIEMASYVGDVLAFYQDSQLQETFAGYSKDPRNLYSLAYMMGYKPKSVNVSEVELEVTQEISAGTGYAPDWVSASVISANSLITATDANQTKFIIDKQIDFSFSSSYDPTDITIASTLTGDPATYEITKKVKAFSSEIVTTTFNVNSSEKFKTFTITDDSIVGILDIADSDNNTWYEVPYLGQDTVYVEESNSLSDSNQVPFNLVLQKAPRRFVTRHLSDGSLQIQFGAGTNSSDDSQILPDPTYVGAGVSQGITRIDHAFDPSNFTYSKAYGIAPSNTVLTVRYLKGGGIAANSPVNTVTSFASTNTVVDQNGATIATGNEHYPSFNNPKSATGGKDGDTLDELRENILRSFNEQNRAVTLQDYTVRAAALPSKFGSVAKVYATQDKLVNSNNTDTIIDNNPLAVSLYVLAYNNEGKLTTATTSLKNNLKTYLAEYMMLSDSLNIKDGFIINIGINYDLIIRPDFISRDVLLNCNLKIQEYLATTKRSINQPINLTELYRQLDRVKGVQTVQKVEVVNKNGGNYSQYGYDIKGATRNNIIYPSYDPSIFEIKYPLSDIRGRITSL